MDITDLLTSGASVSKGDGLHERKASQSQNAKAIAKDVVTFACDHGIEAAATEFSISDTAVAKYLARSIKKESDISADMFLERDTVRSIEELIYAGNTTSIKRICLVAGDRFSEAEIRIVKADIESRGMNQCDF